MDSTGQSGGEKAKLAFTILVAAIAYQYDIDPDTRTSSRFHLSSFDEMFSKVDDQYPSTRLEHVHEIRPAASYRRAAGRQGAGDGAVCRLLSASREGSTLEPIRSLQHDGAGVR